MCDTVTKKYIVISIDSNPWGNSLDRHQSSNISCLKRYLHTINDRRSVHCNQYVILIVEDNNHVLKSLRLPENSDKRVISNKDWDRWISALEYMEEKPNEI